MSMEKLLSMLESPKADTRFDACEQLRIAPQITEEAIAALEKALDDPDQYVRYSAKSALKVHKEVAEKQCPNCGLWHAQIVQRCRCGYRFSTGLITEIPEEKTNSTKYLLIIASLIGFLVSFPFACQIGIKATNSHPEAELFAICDGVEAAFGVVLIGLISGLVVGVIIRSGSRSGQKE